MPETVRIAREFRDAFGPGVSIKYAKENGYEIDRRDWLSHAKGVVPVLLRDVQLVAPKTGGRQRGKH